MTIFVCAGECRSFDCVAFALRAEATSLRMTDLEYVLVFRGEGEDALATAGGTPALRKSRLLKMTIGRS